MISQWKNPLPLGQYTTSRVVVYFYSGRWIPIMYHSLAEAIALHRKALPGGREFLIFPADLNLSGTGADLNELSCTCGDYNEEYDRFAFPHALCDRILEGYAPLEPEKVNALTSTAISAVYA